MHDKLLQAQGTKNHHLEAELLTTIYDKTGKNKVNQHDYRDFPNGKYWTSIVFATSGCWLWVKARSKLGYGLSSGIKAHRLAWELFNGPIPSEMNVLHKCDVRNCVNPSHLFLGTQKDNMQDAARKGRIVAIPKPGSTNPMAKLTKEKVIAMRQLRKTGATYKKIAQKYNVSEMTALRAVKGESWQTLI